jgi:hypothetical protein
MSSIAGILISEGIRSFDLRNKSRVGLANWSITVFVLINGFLVPGNSDAFQPTNMTADHQQSETHRGDAAFLQLATFPETKETAPANSEIKSASVNRLVNGSLNKSRPVGPYQLKARYHLEKGTNQGYLILMLDLAPGAYIHSLTLDEDLSPSKISVPTSADYRVGEKFYPDRAPTVVERDPVFERRMEKHFGQVQFFVPLEVRQGVDLQKLQPQLVFDGQVCTADGICIALSKQIVQAQFGGYFVRSADQGSRNQK